MKQTPFKTAAAAMCLLVLIVHATSAQASAREAVGICLNVLIPSLFPFFVCSVMLTGSLTGQPLRLLRPLERMFRLSSGSASLILVGLLGGYPAGAQSIAQGYGGAHLSREEGRRMLAFCNNAGPAFLFGMVAPLFEKPLIAWILWTIHIVSAWLVSVAIPAQNGNCICGRKTADISLPEALEKSIKITASVCGWVIVFRMVIGLLQSVLFDYMPISAQVLVKGMLELTNGCICLHEISCPGLRFVMASVLLAFGGVCVTMQTYSVCQELPMDLYLPGKLLQTLFSLLLSLPLQRFLFSPQERYTPALTLAAVPLALTAILVSGLKSAENKGSIPFPDGV